MLSCMKTIYCVCSVSLSAGCVSMMYLKDINFCEHKFLRSLILAYIYFRELLFLLFGKHLFSRISKFSRFSEHIFSRIFMGVVYLYIFRPLRFLSKIPIQSCRERWEYHGKKIWNVGNIFMHSELTIVAPIWEKNTSINSLLHMQCSDFRG